jgi:GNAT superfamily N-acetyltransferase
MYVAPPFRGQGIGRALVQAAIAQAKALPGPHQVNLGVTNSNRAAHAVCGFGTYGVEREAMAVGGHYHDTAYMVLRLASA